MAIRAPNQLLLYLKGNIKTLPITINAKHCKMMNKLIQQIEVNPPWHSRLYKLYKFKIANFSLICHSVKSLWLHVDLSDPITFLVKFKAQLHLYKTYINLIPLLYWHSKQIWIRPGYRMEPSHWSILQIECIWLVWLKPGLDKAGLLCHCECGINEWNLASSYESLANMKKSWMAVFILGYYYCLTWFCLCYSLRWFTKCLM